MGTQTSDLTLFFKNLLQSKDCFFIKKLTLAQQKEIEEQKRKLEEEKDKFKRETEAEMRKKIQENETQRIAMEAAMATKMRQTEEERKAMEAKMSGRIHELEAKMKEMNKPRQVVRDLMKFCQMKYSNIVKYQEIYGIMLTLLVEGGI